MLLYAFGWMGEWKWLVSFGRSVYLVPHSTKTSLACLLIKVCCSCCWSIGLSVSLAGRICKGAPAGKGNWTLANGTNAAAFSFFSLSPRPHCSFPTMELPSVSFVGWMRWDKSGWKWKSQPTTISKYKSCLSLSLLSHERKLCGFSSTLEERLAFYRIALKSKFVSILEVGPTLSYFLFNRIKYEGAWLAWK